MSSEIEQQQSGSPITEHTENRDQFRRGQDEESTTRTRKKRYLGFKSKQEDASAMSAFVGHEFFECERHVQGDGYSRLAAYLSTETDILMFRDFSYLRVRSILEQQYQLRKLEDELDEMDIKDGNSGPIDQECLRNRYLDEQRSDLQHGRSRTKVFEELQEKLERYDRMLKNTKRIRGWNRPPWGKFFNLWKWMWRERPLTETDPQYIQFRKELVFVEPKEPQSFDRRIQSLLLSVDCAPIRYLFCTAEQREQYTGLGSTIYSADRIRILVISLTTALASTLQVLPVVILYKMVEISEDKTDQQADDEGNKASSPSSLRQLLIVIAFTIIFCGIMASVTYADRHELFAASAAYCAVLVVFISNI